MNYRIEGHGSICLVRPLDDAARDRLRTMVKGNEDAQWFGGALVVEPRYVEGIREGLEE